ncbi:hypothetical protein GCK72_007487 [Caenorhabditis remanei]|uniref:Uncharacterized protein n=1 Tax=Caenorhabditis remanei TaxID=31234 RepID=A0A6A5HI35_CAERE|nr:hypothetical protein GCK72_007487 [Caenorhabditis remanei]KAF1767528.1 hypothetical protein GCK72_007487 [Caenorhabditis remanei]
MNSIPLQYESLKAVLIHMDANVRFQISRRLPAIRSTEKLVPLRIRKLKLDGVSTEVDNTFYDLGIYRDYEPGVKVPRINKMTNDSIGILHDLDKYGFQISSSDSPLDSGDISFRHPNRPGLVAFQFDDDAHELIYREELKCYEKAIYLRTGQETTGREEPDTSNEWSRVNELRLKHAMEMPMDILEDFADDARAKILPFECRRFDRKPPYTCYIQLTITCSKKTKLIERYAYNMKLYEAMKRLNTLFFGGRRPAIQAQSVQLPRFGAVLRLPVGFRVKTKEVENGYDLNDWSEGVNLMLDASCFPLNVLKLRISNRGREDFELSIVRDAKKLIVHNSDSQFDILPILTTLSNKEVVLADTYRDVPIQSYFGLIENWLNVDKPVGTCYSFGIKQEDTAKGLLKIIKSRLENTKRTKRCISVITGNNTKLEVFYVPIKNPRSREQKEFMYDCKWVLKIRIVRL